ncbi:hypothetical protein Ava_D0007 [Trichormus variabilis ATCC 29413]|uniref:Uncharacterized protein n=2 Tax=Anabaena variabilis TaxID=264691 RepID=Q3M2W4_TRIV2|nr:hypothetical protein [Trichormus variabilis]ABA24672.1 hypothetical protein Ava_D0007 [Trichormus variabilis ATCC 29413]MBC1217707.1 hypothetical protein [Trichormus variabilis ARAD]MBC1259002.1 hypothetical protein [Trichormus variabilis V5]MBC1302713.1 hypothetical protein [Trichormus variabilis N2B]MBC1324568.1 hypothetical protein [Trichormus variabilis 9RC]
MTLKVGENAFHKGLGREILITGEFSTHYQCKDGGTVINASKVEGVDLIQPRTFEVLDGGKEGETIEKININQVSASSLGKALRGVGQLSARKIMERKPEGGYVGLEQLKTLNADLNINWEAVLPHVEF